MKSNRSSAGRNATRYFFPSSGIVFDDLCSFDNFMGVPLAIAVIGTVLNILCFVVFMRPALRRVVTTFYYRVLVLSDILTLNMAVWPLLAKVHETCSEDSWGPTACRSFFYLMNVGMDTNAWALLIVHVETYRQVAHPHLTRINWTLKVAVISAVICFFAALLFNIPIFLLKTNHIAWESVKFISYSVLPLVISLAHNIKTNILLRRSSSTEQVGCCKLTSMATVIMTLCITNSTFTLPYSLYRLVSSISSDQLVVLPGYMQDDCVLMVAYIILVIGCSIKFMVFRSICFRFSGQCNRLFGCSDSLMLPAGAERCNRECSTRSSVRIESILYTNPKK